MGEKRDEYGLTEQQRKFADNFFVSGKAKESAIAAGYKDKAIVSRASKLKRNPVIQSYLEEKARDLIKKDGGRFLALAKQIESKDAYIVKTIELMEAIKDPANSTRFKYWELIGRLRHLNTNEAPKLLFARDGQELSINDIMSGAHKLTGTLREIRFEAEILRKSKESGLYNNNKLSNSEEITIDCVPEPSEPTTNM